MLLLGRHKCSVRVFLNGGLGNQLFQFACGYNIAKERNLFLILDDHYVKRDPKRNFALSSFELNSNTLLDAQAGLKPSSSVACDCNVVKINENCFQFDSSIFLKLPKSNLSLNGYWQSPLYFRLTDHEVRNYLRSFLLSTDQDGHYGVLHVRRGDFASEKKTRNFHGILDITYYTKTLKLLPPEIKKLFIISDSTLEANRIIRELRKSNPELDFSLFDKTSSELDCLALMSGSKFTVIANSSFSWWGAYLSDSKTIIAPRHYFSPQTLRQQNICDLYPSDWYLA
jgi:hypothetical protein